MSEDLPLRSLDSLLKSIVEGRAKAYLERELKWLEDHSETGSLRTRMDQLFLYATNSANNLENLIKFKEERIHELEKKLSYIEALNALLSDKSVKKKLDKLLKQFEKEDK